MDAESNACIVSRFSTTRLPRYAPRHSDVATRRCAKGAPAPHDVCSTGPNATSWGAMATPSACSMRASTVALPGPGERSSTRAASYALDGSATGTARPRSSTTAGAAPATTK